MAVNDDWMMKALAEQLAGLLQLTGLRAHHGESFPSAVAKSGALAERPAGSLQLTWLRARSRGRRFSRSMARGKCGMIGPLAEQLAWLLQPTRLRGHHLQGFPLAVETRIKHLSGGGIENLGVGMADSLEYLLPRHLPPEVP